MWLLTHALTKMNQCWYNCTIMIATYEKDTRFCFSASISCRCFVYIIDRLMWFIAHCSYLITSEPKAVELKVCHLCCHLSQDAGGSDLLKKVNRCYFLLQLLVNNVLYFYGHVEILLSSATTFCVCVMSISAQLLTFVLVLFVQYSEVLYSIVWSMYCLCNIIRFGTATLSKLSLMSHVFSYHAPGERRTRTLTLVPQRQPCISKGGNINSDAAWFTEWRLDKMDH